jgi:hypothetical protein
MSDETTTVDQSTPEQAPAPQPQGPSLQLQDLVLALQTIQAAANRGAVRAEEMSTVGGLHDRLYAFLVAQGVLTTPTAPAEPEAPAEAGETTNA